MVKVDLTKKPYFLEKEDIDIRRARAQALQELRHDHDAVGVERQRAAAPVEAA